MKIDISQKDLGTLCICVMRYCQKQVYMPDLIRRICSDHLHEISDMDLDVMINDCRRMTLYGDGRIDALEWLRWEEALYREKIRRNHEN